MNIAIEPIRIPDSGRANRLDIHVGACCQQGARRNNNEDKEFVSPSHDLFIVADGMGGHAAGELASQFTVDVVSNDLARIANDASDQEIDQRVKSALARAHCMIVDTGQSEPTAVGAGSSVVLALLRNHRLFIAGVGDSRAYLVRNGSLQRLTTDDTWPDTLVQMGQITIDKARKHHMRHCLLNALGMNDFDADREEIHIIDVYAGDRFLLVSDGVTDNVADTQVATIISEHDNPQAAAEELTKVARASGGGDDTTCIVFHVGGTNAMTNLSSGRSDHAAQPKPNWFNRLVDRFRSAS